jgi:hypothetical protein
VQVSCNDFDLVWELDSCYQLEKLATLYKVGGRVVLLVLPLLPMVLLGVLLIVWQC